MTSRLCTFVTVLLLGAAGAVQAKQPQAPEVPPPAEPSEPPAEVAPPQMPPPVETPPPPPPPVIQMAPATPAPAPAAPPSFTVTGTGLLVGNLIYADGPMNNIDPPMWATGPLAGVQGDDGSFTVSGRQSRFGLKAVWKNPPSLLGASEVAGVLEGDFLGAILDNGRAHSSFPIPRLRLAHGSVSWGKGLKLLVGQDWSIFAPVNPDSALHLAVPGFSGTGNLWMRLPQIRIEGVTDGDIGLAWAFAIVQNVIDYGGIGAGMAALPGTFATGAGTVGVNHNANPAELSQIPAIQGRIGLAGKMYGKPMGVGVSGHFARRRFSRSMDDTNAGGVALDWNVPLAEKALVKGEFYYGSAVEGFFGGINQGVNLTTNMMGAITGINEITSMGGWLQGIMSPMEGWTLAVGAGVDRPRSSDIGATQRQLNLGVYGALAYELAKGFSLGVEYNYLHTELKNNANGNSAFKRNVFALNGQLSF